MTYSLVLFDLDGTLSDDRHRKANYVPGKFDPVYWDRDNMLADKPWPQGVEKFREAREAGHVVGILSARQLDYNADVTDEWLEMHDLIPDVLFLKTEHEKHLTPAEFKLSILSNITKISPTATVVMYENDPIVVDLVTQELGAEYIRHATWESEEGEPA